MISTTMATALNEQIKWEMYSANLYLAMSAYLQDAGLTGFAHWMRVQYQEETAHALKFYDFLLARRPVYHVVHRCPGRELVQHSGNV